MTANRRTATIAGLAAASLIFAGCSKSDDTSAPAETTTTTTTAAESTAEAAAEPTEVTLIGERDVEVTLTGPIAAKYSSATEEQKKNLGLPLTGDHNAGQRDGGGVLFQQFQGGVITAKNDDPGTPAFITWGKIRDAWNIERNPEGVPDIEGENGSVGPLGAPTSDEVADGDLLTTTFEHGKITFNTATDEVEVTVNGKVVPSGLE